MIISLHQCNYVLCILFGLTQLLFDLICSNCTGAYTQIGGSSVLVPDPAVLHFGGFKLGQVHRQVVRVVNKSGKGTRLHIIPPSTAFFKVRPVFCLFPIHLGCYHECLFLHSQAISVMCSVVLLLVVR